MRGSLRGVSLRPNTHGTQYTHRQTETDQCVTVEEVAHTVHTEE